MRTTCRVSRQWTRCSSTSSIEWQPAADPRSAGHLPQRQGSAFARPSRCGSVVGVGASHVPSPPQIDSEASRRRRSAASSTTAQESGEEGARPPSSGKLSRTLRRVARSAARASSFRSQARRRFVAGAEGRARLAAGRWSARGSPRLKSFARLARAPAVDAERLEACLVAGTRGALRSVGRARRPSSSGSCPSGRSP